MLYNEFIEGTGCKDNDYNYKIYKRLELMYTADDSITKQEIYEYGKKLVDNSKSEEEIRLEENIKSQIAVLKEDYKRLKKEEARYKAIYDMDRTDKFWKDQMDWTKRVAKETWNKIKNLKMILA